ncbi:MAG TPA: hypothetical protein VMZ53_04905 [Kofleriaceae bacterium]|nr:hypothetical protein [Kofleriaceae bacterium]
MRNTDSFPTIGFDHLADVTGGCGKKKCAPPPPPPQQMAAPQPQSDRGVDVTVATGAAAAQLIGGGAPQIQRA